MKTFASFSAVAVAFALSAAATTAQEPTEPKEAAAPARQVGAQVTVANLNWLDARVYLDDDGLLVPLGFVMSQQTAEFALPARALATSGKLRIVARPIGSRQSYVSQSLLVGRGDVLLVTLHNQLGLSSTSVLPTIE
jgi:hypothetical protein